MCCFKNTENVVSKYLGNFIHWEIIKINPSLILIISIKIFLKASGKLKRKKITRDTTLASQRKNVMSRWKGH